MSKKIGLTGFAIAEYNTAEFEQSDWLMKWTVLDEKLHGVDGMAYLAKNADNRYFNPDLWENETKMFLMEPIFDVIKKDDKK